MRDAAHHLSAAADHETGCITCGDVARPMVVLMIDDSRGLALCADEQERRQVVDAGIVGPLAPGDTVLVHAGTALVREQS